MPVPRTFLCVIIILTLAAFMAAGQTETAIGRTTCVFPLADLSQPAVQADRSSVLAMAEADRSQSLFSALVAEFKAARFQVVPEGQWREKADSANLSARDFLDPAMAARVAGEAGAGIAVSGFFSVEEDRILVSVSCYDSRNGVLVAGFMRTWRYNLGLYSTLHAEVLDLVSQLNAVPVERAQTDGKAAQPIPLLPAVTFTAPQEGMEVLVAGERSAGRIDGGKLVFAAPGLRPGETMLVEKRLAGYHTAWQRVRSASTVSLSPLARTTTIAIETDWTFGQVLGAGGAFRLYLVPDSSFVSLSLYPYGQLPASQWGNWLLHIDGEIAVGSYLFFPPESLVRLGASTGLGLIYSLIPAGGNPSSYFDAYLNLFSFWVELNLPGVSFFVRPEMKVALGAANPNLLGKNVIMADGMFPGDRRGAV